MHIWYLLIDFGPIILALGFSIFAYFKIYISYILNSIEGYDSFLGRYANVMTLVFGLLSIPFLGDFFGFTEKYKVCGVPSNLYIHASVGADSEKIDIIKNRTEVILISEVNYVDGTPWIKISGEGFSGWVNRNYLCKE